VGAQTVIDFEIYRTEREVVDPKREPTRKRTVPVDALTNAGSNTVVLKSERAAMLTVTIGASDRPRVERTVDLQLMFGSTEITASGKATHSGESKSVLFKYDS
jgi:hypothetical protein